MYKSEFEFLLSKTIEFHHIDNKKNISENSSTNRLVLYAPNYHQNNIRIVLQQGLMRALKSINAKDEDTKQSSKDNDVITGTAINAILLMSDIDLIAYFDKLDSLLLDGCCMMDGKMPLKKAVMERIELEDLDKLRGEYIANFIMPSWTKGAMAKSSI